MSTKAKPAIKVLSKEWFAKNFTWKAVRSWIGHVIEGQLLHALPASVASFFALLPLLGLAPITVFAAYAVGGLAPIEYFLGREKRDCEVALGLEPGALSAYFLMHTRFSNIMDFWPTVAVYAGVIGAGAYFL